MKSELSDRDSRNRVFSTLGHEHHHGLTFCWIVRTGLRTQIDSTRITRYAKWFFEAHLFAHFRIEEEQLFPILGTHHELIGQAISEHRRLEELFTIPEPLTTDLQLMETELDHHIRFEERMVFPRIEAIASPEQLALLAEIHREIADADDWEDKFWEET